MKRKDSRRDGQRYAEDEEALRDSHRSKGERQVRESHKTKDRELDGGKDRDSSRLKEEKTSGRDKDRDGRDRERDGHKTRDERENAREKDAAKKRDDGQSERERDNYRSKGGRETAIRVGDEKEYKSRDEWDLKARDGKDRTRKDEKHKEIPKETDSRRNKDIEKHTHKEERIKEKQSRRDKEEAVTRDGGGGGNAKERDGHRLKDEKGLRRREEQSIEGRTREDGSGGGKDVNADYEFHAVENKHKRKEIDREERRERGEKRRREEEDGLDKLPAAEKKYRGEKRKRDPSEEEPIGKETFFSDVSEVGQKNKKHEKQSVYISGSDDHSQPIANNGFLLSTTERSLHLEKSSSVLGGTGTVGLASLADKTNDVADASTQGNGSFGPEGNMVQPLKGQSLSTPDVVEKAKRALLVQKQLNEKLKKLPQVGKPTTQSAASAVSLAAALPVSTTSTSTVPASMDANTTLGQTQIHGLPSAQSTQGSLLGSGIGFVPGMVPGMPGIIPGAGTVSNLEALKRVHEFAARLGMQQVPGTLPLLSMVPGQATDDGATAGQVKSVKAPVLRLDAQGREIDEHGNVLDRPKLTNLSTLKVNINKQKKDAFQILRPDLDEDPDNNPFYDPRMGIDKKKILRPKRSTFQFVEEGRWSKQADLLRLKSQFGEAQAKEIKAKQAALAKAKAEADINPNLIEVSERVPTKEEKPKDSIPEVEWWDAVLLPSGSYEDITEGELKVKMEKLTIYVEHPVPIEPPAEPPPPPPQPLKLTKKEQKKLRTQRRLAKEKDRQEMIRQGLIEPPKPKVKMSNLMKVLGAEATQDPTKLEMEIRTAAAEREQAHTDRNIARKLTPAERREKKERKLFDDPNTLETIVSVYRVDDLSHPQTRFKVDINAQENRLTGCLVICDKMCVVVVEGGPKSIKRYGKLMLQRINWATAVKEEEEGEGGGTQRVNKCVLVWQGSVAKPSFDKFLIQQCRTEATARKYLADAGVGHYWDLAANFTEE